MRQLPPSGCHYYPAAARHHQAATTTWSSLPPPPVGSNREEGEMSERDREREPRSNGEGVTTTNRVNPCSLSTSLRGRRLRSRWEGSSRSHRGGAPGYRPQIRSRPTSGLPVQPNVPAPTVDLRSSEARWGSEGGSGRKREGGKVGFGGGLALYRYSLVGEWASGFARSPGLAVSPSLGLWQRDLKNICI
jgi:hypothetical protein